jgi:hypothetical protein
MSAASAELPSSDKLLATLFEHFVVMKMYHFQTKKAATHKAVDSYVDEYLGLFDQFCEVLQGSAGSNFQTKSLTFSQITMVTDATAVAHLNAHIAMLKRLSYKGTDLLAIRDEMLASVHQLKYLLRFT